MMRCDSETAESVLLYLFTRTRIQLLTRKRDLQARVTLVKLSSHFDLMLLHVRLTVVKASINVDFLAITNEVHSARRVSSHGK
jgi:hypothetical protein